MEIGKDINNYQLSSDDECSNEGLGDEEEIEDEEDQEEEEEDILNEEEQLFLQQQIENEFINAGDEESDDGLVLAGEGTAAATAYNQMMIGDPNLEMNYSKMPPAKLYNGWMQWFISLEDHDFLLEIDKDFINDKMNLIGLRDHFPST